MISLRKSVDEMENNRIYHLSREVAQLIALNMDIIYAATPTTSKADILGVALDDIFNNQIATLVNNTINNPYPFAQIKTMKPSSDIYAAVQGQTIVQASVTNAIVQYSRLKSLVKKSSLTDFLASYPINTINNRDTYQTTVLVNRGTHYTEAFGYDKYSTARGWSSTSPFQQIQLEYYLDSATKSWKKVTIPTITIDTTGQVATITKGASKSERSITAINIGGQKILDIFSSQNVMQLPSSLTSTTSKIAVFTAAARLYKIKEAMVTEGYFMEAYSFSSTDPAATDSYGNCSLARSWNPSVTSAGSTDIPYIDTNTNCMASPTVDNLGRARVNAKGEFIMAKTLADIVATSFDPYQSFAPVTSGQASMGGAQVVLIGNSRTATSGIAYFRDFNKQKGTYIPGLPGGWKTITVSGQRVVIISPPSNPQWSPQLDWILIEPSAGNTQAGFVRSGWRAVISPPQEQLGIAGTMVVNNAGLRDILHANGR